MSRRTLFVQAYYWSILYYQSLVILKTFAMTPMVIQQEGNERKEICL